MHETIDSTDDRPREHTPEVAGLSPNVIVRLKDAWCAEFEEWNRRDLSDRRYVYVWADGMHVNVRLEDEENRRQCLLMLMGATADGHKELIAVADGYRESEQSSSCTPWLATS